MNLLQFLLLLKCSDLVLSICVLDSKRGWWLDCGIRDSYLLRIKDIGGLQANFDFGIGFGDEKGFPNSISRTNKKGQDIPTNLPPPPNYLGPSYGTSYGTSYGSHGQSYGSPDHSYGGSQGLSYDSHSHNQDSYSQSFNSHSQSYDSQGTSYGNPHKFIKKRKDDDTKKSKRKSFFPFSFKLPFFQGSKPSEKKSSRVKSTFLPSRSRKTPYKYRPSSRDSSKPYGSQYSQSPKRITNPFFTQSSSKNAQSQSPKWISVSRRKSLLPDESSSNRRQSISQESYFPSVKPSSSVPLSKRDPGNGAVDSRYRSSHEQDKYNSRESGRIRKVVDSGVATNRRSLFSFGKKEKPFRRSSEDSRFHSDQLNPPMQMAPPPLQPYRPPINRNFNQQNQFPSSSHFNVFHQPRTTTTPRPKYTVGPALGELLKIPAYTAANSDNVPSFAAKTFIVKEAPNEFYPPNYYFYQSPFLEKGKVEIPRTKFYCEEQDYLPGIYADDMLGCKMFHLCVPSAVGSTITSYLCPNGTLFDQSILQCNYWYNVDCKTSIEEYDTNMALALSYRKINAAHLPLDGASKSGALSLLSNNLKQAKPAISSGFSSRRGKALTFSKFSMNNSSTATVLNSSISSLPTENANLVSKVPIYTTELTANQTEFAQNGRNVNSNITRDPKRIFELPSVKNLNKGKINKKSSLDSFTGSIREAVLEVQARFRSRRKDSPNSGRSKLASLLNKTRVAYPT